MSAKPRRPAVPVVLATGLGLLAAGCTANLSNENGADIGADIGAAAPANPEPNPTVASDPAASSAENNAQQIQGPLDDFTMRIWGTPVNETQQAADARLETEARFREEYIAACMAAQGFQYIPDLLNVPTVTVAEGPARGSREFAELYGLGISTDPPMGGGGFQVLWRGDPNQELRDAMSEAELEAWNYALSGESPGRVFFGGAAIIPADVLERGCEGRAWGALLPTGNAEFDALEAELARFTESINTDPQMVALDQEWANCMAVAGHPGLTSPALMRDALWAEWDSIQNWGAASELLMDWDWELQPDGPPGFVVDEQGVGSLVIDPDAVAEFRVRELTMALAEVDCRETLDFFARRLDMEHALQQSFVDMHREELEAWANHNEAARAAVFQ